jgi:hypothetical protein
LQRSKNRYLDSQSVVNFMLKYSPAHFISLYGLIIYVIFGIMRAEALEYPCNFETKGVPAGIEREDMQYTQRYSNDGIILIIEGSINAGESQRLEQAIRRIISNGKISEAWMNSGGGNAAEGMEMGRVLRRYGLPTRIPKGYLCFSACSYAFLGGPFRAVEYGGDYGVHMFTNPNHKVNVMVNIAKDVRTNNKSLTNTERETQSIEQDSAKFAARYMEYLSEMGVSTQVGLHNFETKNHGESCPPPSVLRQWNVVNSD